MIVSMVNAMLFCPSLVQYANETPVQVATIKSRIP